MTVENGAAVAAATAERCRGVTMTRDCRQPAQTLASPTQKRRSVRRSLGRRTVLLYTANCWCKARFSRAKLAMATEEEREEPKQVEQEGDHRAGIVTGSEPTDQPHVRRTKFLAKDTSHLIAHCADPDHFSAARPAHERQRQLQEELQHAVGRPPLDELGQRLRTAIAQEVREAPEVSTAASLGASTR